MSNPRTVLLVDDDEAILEMYGFFLEERGHKVLRAMNGKEALAHFESQKIDIIFLDVLMPQKDGLETLFELRTRFPDLPVYIISGALKETDFVSAANVLRATGIIYKPAPPSKLIRLIESTE